MDIGAKLAGTRRHGTLRPKKMVQLSFDVPMVIILFSLTVIGILMVYSASWDFSLKHFDDSTQIFFRQLAWVGLSILAVIVLALIDYRVWRRWATLGLLISVVLLLLVLLVGQNRLGAVRAILEGSVQPSELAKLMVVVYLSVWLHSKREHLQDVTIGMIPLSLILGFIGGLIWLQPDVSAVLTVLALGGLMFFLAGGDLKQISILILVALVAGWIVVTTSLTARSRVEVYLDGVENPAESSYHVRRSLEAFVQGGWFGKGIGNSVSKVTGLPVPPTDSIFAVIGEETGILGATVVVSLFAGLLWRGMVIARKAPDLLGMLLAAGLTIWIVLEAFLNMAVILGLAPFAGNALPFISAGGSSMVVSMAAMGIVLNISRLGNDTQLKRATTFPSVIDFGRRGKPARPGRGTRRRSS